MGRACEPHEKAGWIEVRPLHNASIDKITKKEFIIEIKISNYFVSSC